ncbi:hypothetical protein SAMN05443245_1087 [Paraburkholderia fungorum]|uniref:Uncharacterized protein n=1 Tax=Paraburkholderia fungorum TaxID=134537 RepID=A0A1H1A9F6_9BURK|nr:hypothetical protein SAMN05443245_1087 [Paraburkholderia fungorum]
MLGLADWMRGNGAAREIGRGVAYLFRNFADGLMPFVTRGNPSVSTCLVLGIGQHGGPTSTRCGRPGFLSNVCSAAEAVVS